MFLIDKKIIITEYEYIRWKPWMFSQSKKRIPSISKAILKLTFENAIFNMKLEYVIG